MTVMKCTPDTSLSRIVEKAEKEEKRSMALEKAQHLEELKKIQILEKQRVGAEHYKETQVLLAALSSECAITVLCFSQEKHAQAQQIKHEIEALKRKVCSILTTHGHRQAYRDTDTDIHTHTQTRQTDRQLDRQTGTQIDRQTLTDTNRKSGH
jgi:hypothetical protein